MTDLDRIVARRTALQAELADLEVAERVLRSLNGHKGVAEGSKRRSRREDGVPAHQAVVLDMLTKHGGTMERQALFEALNDERLDPMGEATYASILSRMGTSGLIARENGQVSRVQPEMPM